MRVVRSENDLESYFKMAQSEAAAAFGKQSRLAAEVRKCPLMVPQARPEHAAVQVCEGQLFPEPDGRIEVGERLFGTFQESDED